MMQTYAAGKPYLITIRPIRVIFRHYASCVDVDKKGCFVENGHCKAKNGGIILISYYICIFSAKKYLIGHFQDKRAFEGGVQKTAAYHFWQ